VKLKQPGFISHLLRGGSEKERTSGEGEGGRSGKEEPILARGPFLNDESISRAREGRRKRGLILFTGKKEGKKMG